MDYGKLAYIKAEELEGRINVAEKKTALSTGYTTRPNYTFDGRAFYVCTMRASGSVTVLVRGEITLEDSAAREVSVLVGGLVAQRTSVSGSGKQPFFLMSAVYVNGVAEVSVKCANGLMRECQVLVYGDNAELICGGGGAAVDKLNDQWMLVSTTDDYVKAYLFTESAFQLSGGISVGGGSECDVAANNDRFAVVHLCDGNAFVSMIVDGAMSVQHCVGTGERVAICAYRDGFIVALLAGGEVECRFISKEGGYSAATSVFRDASLTDIGFVKGDTPTLIVKLGENNYLKPSLPEHGGDEIISLNILITMEAVNV